MLTGVMLDSAFEIPRLWGQVFPRAYADAILVGTPFFPAQIIVALLLGWAMGYQTQGKSAAWVWVIPSVALLCAFVALPTLTSLGFSLRISRLFGWGCRPDNRCFDQRAITLPFYTAIAYSAAVLFARKAQSFPSHRKSEFALIIGSIFLASTVLELVESLLHGWESVPEGWRWLIFTLPIIPASIGIYLIHSAYGSLRTRQNQVPGRP